LKWQKKEAKSKNIFIKDLHNNVVWLNKSFALAIGKPQETLIKCTVEELFSGCSEVVDINSYLADDLEVINSKIPKCDFIEKLPTLTKTLWVKTTKIPLLDKNEVIGIIGMSFDISDQYTINMEFELLLESLSDSLIITDHNGIILKIYKGKTGLIKDYNENIGKNIHSLFSVREFSDKVDDQIGNILSDIQLSNLNPFGYYFEFSTKDKQYEITIDLFNHSKLVFSIRDISLRKKLDKFDHLLEEVRSMNSSMIKSLITE